jgi:hypothetical protein
MEKEMQNIKENKKRNSPTNLCRNPSYSPLSLSLSPARPTLPPFIFLFTGDTRGSLLSASQRHGRARAQWLHGGTHLSVYPLPLLIPSRHTETESCFSRLGARLVRSVVGVYSDSWSSAHPAAIKSCPLPSSLPMASTLRWLGSFVVRRRPCLRQPLNSPATGMTALAPGMLGVGGFHLSKVLKNTTNMFSKYNILTGTFGLGMKSYTI